MKYAYKMISSVSALLLLIILVAGDMQLEDESEDDYDTLAAIEKKREKLKSKEIRGKGVVAIDNEVLKSILRSNTSLKSTYKNITRNFFSEFRLFLIPFSWEEPEKNDVLKLTANYNKNRFENGSHQSIRLWVSFEPSSLYIKDDIAPVLDVINNANSIYSETISAVILNYGLLSLDSESLVVVNHEIEKVSQILKDAPGKKLLLGLQLDVINCENRIEFTKNLKLGDVDIIHFSVPNKDFVVIKHEDFLGLILASQISCLAPVVYKVPLSLLHMRMSIKISLGLGLYDYLNGFETNINPGIRHIPRFFWSEEESQRKIDSNTRNAVSENNPKWTNWLQKPSNWLSIPPTYYYINIVGCNSNYSSTRRLTEFVLFYEKLNNWAVSRNTTVYVDAMIENPGECERKRMVTPEMNCTCGWWVAEGFASLAQPSPVIIFNKKALAISIYEKKLMAQAANDKMPVVSAVSKELLVAILVPFFLIVALIPAVTVVLVLRYRSKYIMTKEEVANFLKGQLQENEKNEEGSPENAPYDNTKYELMPSLFKIDKSSCVGSGEFGKVFRGSITRAGETTVAAVKVANTKELGKSHGGRMALMGLLSEIKILSYLGEHEHIVALLGAFTGKLRKGELSVFLEFCELGSLYTYLRSIQSNRQNAVGNEYIDAIPLTDMAVQNVRNNHRYTLGGGICDELYGYCGQIACGMTYLSAKNVVHADLATRNVLLTREKVVKVSDFGLSRRMYDYSEYVKQSQAPLPWRWMAPESLQRMVFNEKSDVWAFGVTLWEIFTLGDQPYPGLSYDVNFPAMLARGLRLPEPGCNVKEIYAVMTRCWNANPVDRPSFAELNTKLNEI